MSSDIFIHATKDNWPIFHRYLGGNGVKDEMHYFFKGLKYEEIEAGWDLICVTKEQIIDFLIQLEANYGIYKYEIIEEIKLLNNCQWFMWWEY